MKIKYLGHSSFLMTASTGTAVVCDPYDSAVGFAMPSVRADVVTLSHHHYDHDNVAAVSGAPVVLDKAQERSLSGVEIKAIKSFHDEVRGAKRGENVIFKFRMDGLDVCHLGDLGESCSPELIQAIAPVNVLLIPVGGTYTIDAAAAKKYVDAIKPDVVIPMHFRTKDCTLNIDGADRFLRLFGNDTQIEEGANEITLSREDIGGKRTKIIVMERE